MQHRKLLVVVSLLGGFISTATFAADPVPCEQSLSDLKVAVGNAHLSDTDKAKVADLESQGIERCKADDDAGADALFAEAMKVMRK